MSKQEIVVNRVIPGESVFPIVPLTARRSWMNDSRDKFAYKCIPLNIANQYGYAVLCPADFTLDWYGGVEEKDVDFHVTSKEEYFEKHLHSYFGGGTFTIHVDFIIRTPEGFSTYIRGVPNETKHGLKPLDAIVETDWLSYTFTYNFLLTEPGSYSFKKGEPLFVFFPIERGTVENFELKESRVENDPNLLKDFDLLNLWYRSNLKVELKDKSNLGKEVALTVTRLGLSDMAMAVQVDGFPSNNEIPHITIAINPENGKPAMSKEITKWQDIKTFMVKGVVTEITNTNK
jgi:hypothetical protein